MHPIDKEGRDLNVGDRVVIMEVTNRLLDGLPAEDQEAIRCQVGKTVEVRGFDDTGLAEIDFQCLTPDRETVFHTIWLEPACLRKTGP